MASTKDLDFASSSCTKFFESHSEYVRYWKSEDAKIPIRRMEWRDGHDVDSNWGSKFDWERYVLVRKAAWKFAQRGKMVSNEPPKKRKKILVGPNRDVEVDAPYQTVYYGKLANSKSSDIFHTSYNLHDSDRRSDKIFTVGNMEAAFRITKHIWSPRLFHNKRKQNWLYCITPICMDFLYLLDDLLSGYHDAVVTRINETPEIRGSPEVRELVVEGEPFREIGYDRFDTEPIEEDHAEVPTNLWEFKAVHPEHIERVVQNDNVDETSVETAEKENCECTWDMHRTLIPKYRQAREHRNPFRWYPKRDSIPASIPWWNMTREHMERTFFEDLESVYLRIGRPDLAAKIGSPARFQWLRRHVIGSHEQAGRWNSVDRDWDPTQYVEREWEAQSGECIVGNKHRDKVLRMLTSYNTLLKRHRDKMEVLSHRGRFAYLRDWDLNLFARQKRVVESIDIEGMKFFVQLNDFPVDWRMPRSYVEQADYLVKQITKAETTQKDYEVFKACRCLAEFVLDWKVSEFDESRTRCWEAQSNDQPLKSAGAPTTQSSGDPVGKDVVEAPITSGDKTVTATMVDQRASETAKPSQIASGKKSKDSTEESLYNLLDIVKRPMMIDRFQWQTGDELLKRLARYTVPNVYFSADQKSPTVCQNLNASYVLAMFGSATFDMKVKVQVNSVKFQQGKLIVVFRPFYYTDRKKDVPHNLTQFPHVFINANVSNPVELEIPWTNIRDAFPIYTDPHNEVTYFGTVEVFVWNPLQTGTNSSNDASVTVWMWLENLQTFQLCNPKNPGNVKFAENIRGGFGEFGEEGSQLLNPHTVRILAIRDWEPQSLESLVAQAGPLVADVGANLVESVLKRVLPSGDNCKPHTCLPPLPVRPEVSANTSWGKGVSLASTLALDPLTAVAPPIESQDIVELKDLMTKWSRVFIGEWRVEDEENAKIIGWPVMPMLQSVQGDKQFVCQGAYRYIHDESGSCINNMERQILTYYLRNGCMLDYLSRMFLYWRGSLKFKLEVVATNMHSGRLVIRYEPFGSEGSAIAECQKIATPAIIWDLQEKHELEFEAPYMSVQPYLLTQYISSGNVWGKDLSLNHNGLVEITVMNRLKVTTGIASKVQLNVYMAAGDNFEFHNISPLDGVVQVRDHAAFYTAIGDGTTNPYHKMLEVLWSWLTAPIDLDWFDVEVVSKAGEYAKVVGRKSGCLGPFAMRTKDQVLDFKTFMENIRELDKHLISNKISMDKKMNVPKFKSLERAYEYIRGLPFYEDEFTRKFRGFPASDSIKQKYSFWLAIALMREYAWSVDYIPHFNPDIYLFARKTDKPKDDVKVSEYKRDRDWDAQSNDSAKGKAINPFNKFVPPQHPGQHLLGENHNSLYAILKREVPWMHQTMPVKLGQDGDSTIAKEQWLNHMAKNIGKMSTQQAETCWVEWRIPVTPMLPSQSLGETYHFFTLTNAAETMTPMGNDNMPFTSNGADGAVQCALTPHKFIGELFTFWKGSMRYKFVVRNPYDIWGNPWFVTLVHHPRNFTPFNEMWTVNLIHNKRYSDLCKMGTVLFNGNVMSTMDVQIPYKSRYGKLYLSDSYYDETTTNGSISVLIPLRAKGYGQCVDWDKVDVKQVILDGLDVNLWVAAGEDLRYMVPRAAPPQLIWPAFYNKESSWNEVNDGYDDVKAQTVQEPRPSMLGDVYKRLQDPGKTAQTRTNMYRLTTAKVWLKRELKNNAKWPTAPLLKHVETYDWHGGSIEPEAPKGCYEPQSKDEPIGSDPVPEVESVDVVGNVDPQAKKDELDAVLDSLVSASKSLPSILTGFNDAVVKTGEVMTNLNKLTGQVTKTAAKLEENSTEVASTIKDTSGKIGTVATYAFNGLRVGMFFKGLYDAMQAETWNERWIPIAQCAVTLGLSPEVVMKAGEWLMGSISAIFGSEKVHESPRQAEAYEDEWNKSWSAFIEEHVSMFRFIAAGVITIVTFYLTSDAPVHAKVTSFATSMINKLRNFAIVGTAIKTLDWMWRWVGEMIKSAVYTVADFVSGGMVTAHQMSNKYPEVISWLKSIEVYKTDTMKSMLTWQEDARLDLWKKMDEGDAILKQLGSKTGSLFNTLSRGMATLEKAHIDAVHTRSATPFREDPFHICLVGDPGVGKSSILLHILKFMSDEAGFPKRHRIYVRGEDDEFWSNYWGQPVVVIDDLYSDKKAKAIKELIKMKSNLAYPLNMADLPEKGRSFMSKLIGSTTNTMFPKPDDMTCPLAIWRRRNMLVEVKRGKPLIEGQKMSWKDLKFNLLVPAQKNGQRELMKGNLSLDQLMWIAAESFVQWTIDQRSLVLSCLQGKKFPEVDYGDEWADQKEVETANDAIAFALSKGKDLAEPVLVDWALNLSKEEWTKQVVNNEKVYRKLRDSNLWEELTEKRILRGHWVALKSHINSNDIDAAEKLVDYLSAQNQMMFEQPAENVKEWKCMYKGQPCNFGGSVKVTLLEEHQREWQAQSEIDDILDEVYEEREEFDKRASDMRKRARESVEKQESLLEGVTDVVKSIIRKPPIKKTHVLSDDKEIEAYVGQLFAAYEPRERKKICELVKKTFDNVMNKDHIKMSAAAVRDSAFQELFEEKARKYWKKSEDNHYFMEFPEDTTDEEIMSMYTAYEYMKDVWSEKEIDEACRIWEPTKEVGNPYLVKLVKYAAGQKAAVQKWFAAHPKMLKLMKIGGAIAALFVGYKIISWVCPTVIEKIKAIWFAIFGWVTAKVGEERVDRIRQKGSEVVSSIRNKTHDYYDWVRGLMRSSKDPDIRDASRDDEAVHMFAEGLERQMKHVKNVIVVRDSQQPEGKKKMPNAYMLGQDRVHEGEEKPKVRVPQVMWEVQGSQDPNATSFRKNTLIKNVCTVMWADQNKSVSMCGLFIGGRKLLIPYHFFASCQPGQMFAITLLNELVYYQIYDPEQCVKLGEIDVCVYECSIRVGMFKDIIKHFIRREDIRFQRTPATLNVPSCMGNFITSMTEACLVKGVDYSKDGEVFYNDYAWEYSATTAPGDCGSVLLADSTSIQSKILGVHVCGDKVRNLGSSALICRDELEKACALLKPATTVKATNYVPECLITPNFERAKIVPQGNFEVLGVVSPSKETRLPHKTEILKSPIYDMVREHVTEPSVLTANDPRNESGESPLGKAISKYGKPTLPFSYADLDYITQDIQAEVMTWSKPMDARLLTDHEAVFGNEMVDFCDRMNLAASPGYPWTLERPSGEKGKAYLYDILAEDGIRDENYRYCYQTREKMAQAGMRKISVWTDCLKDERRPLEKIRAGKTRAFMLPPADYVQLCRKYFMAFCVCFYSNNVQSFSAVGLDPYSFAWTRLYRKLKRNSNLGFGGDFHSFDGIFDPDILYRIMKIINYWYTYNAGPNYCETDNTVREVLMEEMIHTLHICMNTIYRKCQGNPSGNPLTVIINTFAHCFYLRLAWLNLARSSAIEKMSMNEYHKYVAEIYYGDDGLLTVKYDVKDWFNLNSVSDFLRKFGIEYTCESKDGEMYGVRPVRECTFLKNGFSKLKNSSLWLAPISQDTIFELTNWIRKSDDPIHQMRENLECAEMFAFHHGRDFFEIFCSRVNEALAAKGFRVMPYSYDIREMQFRAKCGT